MTATWVSCATMMYNGDVVQKALIDSINKVLDNTHKNLMNEPRRKLATLSLFINNGTLLKIKPIVDQWSSSHNRIISPPSPDHLIAFFPQPKPPLARLHKTRAVEWPNGPSPPPAPRTSVGTCGSPIIGAPRAPLPASRVAADPQWERKTGFLGPVMWSSFLCAFKAKDARAPMSHLSERRVRHRRVRGGAKCSPLSPSPKVSPPPPSPQTAPCFWGYINIPIPFLDVHTMPHFLLSVSHSFLTPAHSGCRQRRWPPPQHRSLRFMILCAATHTARLQDPNPGPP